MANFPADLARIEAVLAYDPERGNGDDNPVRVLDLSGDPITFGDLRALLAAAKVAQGIYEQTTTDEEREGIVAALDDRGSVLDVDAIQGAMNDLRACESALAAAQAEATRLKERVGELEDAIRSYTEPAMQTVFPGKMFEHFAALLSAAKVAQATYERRTTDDERRKVAAWAHSRLVDDVLADLSSCERALAASQREVESAMAIIQAALKVRRDEKAQYEAECAALRARVAELEYEVERLRQLAETSSGSFDFAKMYAELLTALSEKQSLETALTASEAARESAERRVVELEEALHELHDYHAADWPSGTCADCDGRSPLDMDGSVNGPVFHADDCPTARARALLARKERE